MQDLMLCASFTQLHTKESTGSTQAHSEQDRWKKVESYGSAIETIRKYEPKTKTGPVWSPQCRCKPKVFEPLEQQKIDLTYRKMRAFAQTVKAEIKSQERGFHYQKENVQEIVDSIDSAKALIIDDPH
jgi:hypothetical protein